MSPSLVWNGRPITVPGIYAGIPIDIYHSAMITGDEPSVSASVLQRIWNQSPAHYWAKSVYNPARIADDETASLILGRAAHHVLVGEKFFSEQYVIRPERLDGAAWNGNRTACRDWLRRQRRTVLTPAQADTIKGMALALGRHPLVTEGALNGEIERSIFWRDSESGLWLKARPDVVPTASGNFVDLKTTRSTQYYALQKSLGDYGYYMQAALVAEGIKALGLPFESFTLLFIESERPHCVRDATLKDNDLALGVDVNRLAITTFVRCWENKQWPGPGGDQVGGYIELSQRDRERIEQRIAFEKLGQVAA